MNGERWTVNGARWTENDVRGTRNGKRWTGNKERWTMNGERWTMNRERWTSADAIRRKIERIWMSMERRRMLVERQRTGRERRKRNAFVSSKIFLLLKTLYLVYFSSAIGRTAQLTLLFGDRFHNSKGKRIRIPSWSKVLRYFYRAQRRISRSQTFYNLKVQIKTRNLK